MRETQQLTQLVIESSHDGIAVFDRDMRYTVWNPAMERLSGLAAGDVLGKAALEVFPHMRESGGYDIILRALAGETVTQADRPFRVPATGRHGFIDLRVAPLRDDAGKVVGGFSMVRDVTERRELEEQLRQSQKMEAIGQLAGGVAHDFNNLLTAIRGFNELLAQRVTDEVSLQYSAEVAKASDQAASLVHQLLAFARREMVKPRELDLNNVITRTEQMLRRLIGETIALTVHAPVPAPWVRADPGEIEQILLNLAVNARDAMPAGGRLEIETTVEADDVVLRVEDSGVGMDEETLKHAFEPFFTTKPVGYGTGLGLTTVYAIVERSGGRISIETERGNGTTVSIWLPRVEPAIAGPELQPIHGGGPAAIVLAEDAASVRAVTRAMLESAGYAVYEATDGPSALDLLRSFGGKADLLLTDVVIPGLSGHELAARARAEWPELPVILMTGYSQAAEGEGDTGERVLRKPFTRDELLTRVGQELATRPDFRPGLRCLVADDHPSVCIAVVEALRARGVETLAVAHDGSSALEQIEAMRPHVAVVDARMPGLEGIELARRTAESLPETRVIVYSGFADRALVERALAAGAAGFVLKGAPLADLVKAVETVAAGGRYVDPQMGAAAGGTELSLTPREGEVLRLVADGLTNVDIAARLHISAETVQTHVRRAMSKLEAESRTQAVAKALRQELIA
jgi:PAS domain S-box-containing protein